MISDPLVGGEAFVDHDFSLIGSCPDAFVEIEANVGNWGSLEAAMCCTDENPHPLQRWGLRNVRVVAVFGNDWLTAGRTCERDVPPWP